MKAYAGKNGFVLIVSVIILLSLSIIAGAFVQLVTVRTRASASSLDSAKAFWIAEGGIQQVIYRLKNDTNYRSSPTSISGNLGGGSYSVAVTKQSGQTVYAMVSTGTVGVISRNINQTATVAVGWGKPFNDYGAFAGGASISLKNSAKIVGDAYTTGSVSTASSSTVTGKVYANSGSGNYARLPLPSPTIPSPTLDSTYYTALINTAKTQTSGNKVYTTLALTGGTLYVNGTINAKNITGAGIVVSTGNITITGGDVAQGITIISDGRISFSSSSHIQSGCILYAKTSFAVTNSSVIMDNAALLTPGTVSITQDLKFNGVIFSGGAMTIGSSAIINGAVASGGLITVQNTAQVVQNKNQLPPNTPNGVDSATNVVLSGWQSS